jgi:hypothetical protein
MDAHILVESSMPVVRMILKDAAVPLVKKVSESVAGTNTVCSRTEYCKTTGTHVMRCGIPGSGSKLTK